MGKGIIIGLIVLVLILGSLYYFSINAPSVRTQNFLEIVNARTEAIGLSLMVTDVNVSDLDYYRYACQFDYEVGLENMIALRNMNCDPDKVRELLSSVPEDSTEKQRLYLILSAHNAVRIQSESFREKVNDIYSRKGFTSGENAELLSFFVLEESEGTSWTYIGPAMSLCHQYHNDTLRCIPALVEALSNANEDLVQKIYFGENFISECMQSEILSMSRILPQEMRSVNLDRENCGRIAEIYQWVFDDVKDEDMDANGKFMILNTFYLISKSFEGQKPRSVEAINEFNDMMKKYIDTEFSDIFESI